MTLDVFFIYFFVMLTSPLHEELHLPCDYALDTVYPVGEQPSCVINNNPLDHVLYIWNIIILSVDFITYFFCSVLMYMCMCMIYCGLHA